MTNSRALRIATAAALSITGIAGIALVNAGTAQAADVSVPLYCDTSAYGTTYDYPQTLSVSLTPPATINGTGPVTVAVNSTTPVGLPIPVSGAAIQATLSVRATNATTSSATTSTTSGALSPAQYIPASSNLVVDVPLNASVTLPASTAGDTINYALSEFRVDYVSGGGMAGAVMTCSPQAGVVTVASSNSQVPVANSATNCVAYAGNYGTTSTSTITNPDPTPGNPNGCFTEQDVLAVINAGTLRQDISVAPASINPNAATIDLGSTPVAVNAATVTGKMNPVTVTDTRGSTFVWGLTGQLMQANFTNTNPLSTGVIPAANATVSARSCTILVGSAPGCFAPSGPSPLNAPALLAAKTGAVGSTGSTAGSYVAAADINLTVPAFTGVGTYKNILRVTLS